MSPWLFWTVAGLLLMPVTGCAIYLILACWAKGDGE